MHKAIYFKSYSCGVCTSLLPKVERLFLAEFPLLDFEVIQVEKEPERAAEMGVFTVPVLIVFFENKEHFRFVRNFSIQEVEAKITRPYSLLFE